MNFGCNNAIHHNIKIGVVARLGLHTTTAYFISYIFSHPNVYPSPMMAAYG